MLREAGFAVEAVLESVRPPSVISSTALKPVVVVRGADRLVSPV
jgi:hypothetical protein